MAAGSSEGSGVASDLAWVRFHERDIFADGFEDGTTLANWSAAVP